MNKSFSKNQDNVKKSLEHAFRYGTSAFRFGLIPQGISDHLPIVSLLPLKNSEITMLSWNLLADEHLYNNFMNISGSSALQTTMNETLGPKENIYNGAMYHLFAELAQFLYEKRNQDTNDLVINAKILSEFIPNSAQPSLRARSRTPEIAQEKIKSVEKARSTLVDLLNDANNPNKEEYQLAIKHSLELIYHIKHPNGALRWDNRFSKLKENKKAVAELMAQDIITFQECTKPSDIEGLFIDNDPQNQRMEFISHCVSAPSTSTDNVVLAYDKNKFVLVETTEHENPLKTSFEGKKPALYCKLKNIQTGEVFIAGSIHHPGGNTDLRHEIMDNIQKLQGDNSQIPFFIAGDYNHTHDQFLALTPEENSLVPELFYPSNMGTMAGSDYGNTNQSIDAIMSNSDLSESVRVSSTIQPSPPAKTPMAVSFENNQNDMKNNLMQAVNLAKSNYLKKKYRPGYPQTNNDISIKKPPIDIETLSALIKDSIDPVIALNHVTDQLTNEKANWKNYDFNQYLIDALKQISRDPKQSIAVIDWDCFTPSAVKIFEGVVYRGTSSPPEKVFAKGFSDYVPSSDVEDYTNVRNLNTGVSTSRSYSLAESYTRVASRQGKSRYVYTILYRGIGAVDIIETAKARGVNLNSMTNPQATRALEKDEINIIEKIPAQQILYATEFLADGSQIIHKNPHFNGQHIVQTTEFASERPNKESGILPRINAFFAEVFSFFKVLIWAIKNREKISAYGIKHRQEEINKTPVMLDAEKQFIKTTNPNSAELIAAHIAINEPVSPAASPKTVTHTMSPSPFPDNMKSSNKLNYFNIIDNTERLGELVTLKP